MEFVLVVQLIILGTALAITSGVSLRVHRSDIMTNGVDAPTMSGVGWEGKASMSGILIKSAIFG